MPPKTIRRRPAAAPSSGACRPVAASSAATNRDRPAVETALIPPPVARPPLWSFQDIEVVYISKVLKCDASFLALRPYGTIFVDLKCNKLFIEDPSIVPRFEPLDEHKAIMMSHTVRVKVPRNAAARDELPDDEYGGIITEYVSISHPISTDMVVLIMATCLYPLE